MEKKNKEVRGLIIEIILAVITVIGCISMPDALLDGERVLGLKFLGTTVLIEGLLVIMTLSEGILPGKPEEEGILLGGLNALFSVLYFITMIIIWSSIAGIDGILNSRNLVLGGIWVTLYPFISVLETLIELLGVREDE